MAPPPDAQVPLRAGTVPLAAGHLPKEILPCGIAGNMWVPSLCWGGGGWENMQLPWEQVAETCRHQSDSWKPGQVPACQMCSLPSPFPSHGVQGGLYGGICDRGRAAATGVGQEGQVPDWTKPAAHRSLVRANHNHWHLQRQRSRAFLTGLPLWPCLPGAYAGP